MKTSTSEDVSRENFTGDTSDAYAQFLPSFRRWGKMLVREKATIHLYFTSFLCHIES
jgi:hypothetical protein